MWNLDLQMMMDAMKAENEKLAAAGGGGEGDSKLQEMLAAKQAELMVIFLLRRRIAPVLTPFEVEPSAFARREEQQKMLWIAFLGRFSWGREETRLCNAWPEGRHDLMTKFKGIG